MFDPKQTKRNILMTIDYNNENKMFLFKLHFK